GWVVFLQGHLIEHCHSITRRGGGDTVAGFFFELCHEFFWDVEGIVCHDGDRWCCFLGVIRCLISNRGAGEPRGRGHQQRKRRLHQYSCLQGGHAVRGELRKPPQV